MRIVNIQSYEEICEALRAVGVDPYGIGLMANKACHINVLVSDQPCKVANILKQEMLSLGADAAVARGAVSCSLDKTDVLLMGTRKQLELLRDRLARQPFGLSRLGEEIGRVLENHIRSTFVLKTSRREIDLSARTQIMGILNVTPDSFSDGDLYLEPAKAIAAALKMADEGVDIIDVGGESTRPGAKPVSVDEEIKRVAPVIEAICKKTSLPVSVDTTKASVAQKAMEAGAEIVNDISSLNADSRMIDTVLRLKPALVLMHMRGTPETMQTGDLHYDDLMEEIFCCLKKAVDRVQEAGLEREKLVIDPGIGFGKTAEDNLKILKNLSELKSLGLPILVGSSRKSFIGAVTGEEPGKRLEGTAATVAAAIFGGCRIVRVHDVAAMKKVAALTDAIVRA